MALKIGFQITKVHPYKSDGDTNSQCFMALVREAASNPSKIYNLADDGCLYHKCPKTGDIYKIELLFKSS